MWNFKILTIKRMEKRMAWEYFAHNRTPLVCSDWNVNSDTRQRLNEILLGPKCLPWVDVKGLFVLKNAFMLTFPFFLFQAQPPPSTPQKPSFIGFVLCAEHFSYYVFYSSHLSNHTKAWATLPCPSCTFFMVNCKKKGSRYVCLCVYLCMCVWGGWRRWRINSSLKILKICVLVFQVSGDRIQEFSKTSTYFITGLEMVLPSILGIYCFGFLFVNHISWSISKK